MKEVQLPTGEIVGFPDSMDDAAIKVALAKKFPKPRSPTPAEPTKEERDNLHPARDMNFGEKALVGVGAAMDRAARGITGLVAPAISGAENPYLRNGREDAEVYARAHPGGWATAGEIGADLLMSAAPVAGMSSRVAVLANALRAGRAAPLAGDIAANAAYAAATTPEDRGSAAAWGGGGAAAGRAASRVASGAVRSSQDAAALMQRGVRLTPGQAGEGIAGSLARVYEEGLSAVPVLGSGVRNARQQGLEDWNRLQHANANPNQPASGPFARPVSIRGDEEPGMRGVRDVQGVIKDSYNKVLPKGVQIKFDADQATAYSTKVVDLAETITPSAREKFNDVSNWIGKQLGFGIDASQWKETVSPEIAGAIKAAKRDGQYSLVVALTKLDKHLNSLLPTFQGMPKAAEKVPALDKAFRLTKTLEKVANQAGPAKRGGVAYPSEFVQPATKASQSDLLAAALRGQQIFGSPPTDASKLGDLAKAAALGVGGHAAGLAALPPAALSLLGTTEAGRKFLLGQLNWQQFARQYPQQAAQIGRAIGVQGGQ